MRKKWLFLVPMAFALAAAMGFAQKELSNAQIVGEIQDKLYHAKIFKHGSVQASFADGVATLNGTVDSLGVKNDAARAARKLDDVRSVVNDIRVQAPGVTDAQIAKQVRKEIITYPFYTIFDDISLRVQNGALTVSGQVTDPYKQSDIGEFLSHVKGVTQLTNDIEVLPTSIFDDQLRRSIARAIYRDPYFVNYANQALPPIHIIVKNGNVTLKGVVNSAVDKARAEADARFAATYFSLGNNLRVESER